MDIARPDLKQRRKVKRLVVAGVAGAVLLGSAVAAITLGNSRPTLRQSDVLIDTVRRGSFVRTVRGPGKLVPSQMRWAIARSEASVERLLVRPGASVTADTPIIELTNPDVLDRLQAAELAHAAAEDDHRALQARLQADILDQESEYAAIEGDLEAARVEEEASRRGLEKGVLSEVEYRKRQIALQQLGQRVRIAGLRVQQSKASMHSQLVASQARLDQLANTRNLRKLEADSLRLRAGLDGVVQQIQVEEGQRVTAGQSLARVARQSSLIAELRIPETQSADLATGQAAQIEVGRARVPGKVRRINPAVERGSILVEVDLSAPLPEGVRPEQSVDGSITTERVADTLFVGRPVNAMPSSTGSVFRLQGTDLAERVDVRFGKDSVNQIEVVQGLREGDRIILSDTGRFNTFSEVSVE